MTRNDKNLMQNATTIAEEKTRQARAHQAAEVKKMLDMQFRALSRAIRRVVANCVRIGADRQLFERTK